jgi:signal transduction histidine kinase
MGMASDNSKNLHDPLRLNALRRTALLDSPAEASFDRLTRLAVRLLRVPVALISLVDEQRQFFKSHAGLAEPWATRRQTPLSHSFCQHVVTSGQPLIVEDARNHPLVRNNLAVADLQVVAYAGVPLVSPEGHVLGSFCAIDTQPRAWKVEEVDALKDLAALAMSEIGLKRARDAAEAASKAKDRFLAVLSHELRTPVSPALLIATSMAADPSLPTETREDARTIQRNIAQQTRLIDDLLDVTRIENGKLALHLEVLDLHDVLRDCVTLCSVDAAAKGVQLQLLSQAARHNVRGDQARLRQLFINLLKNAVKFTPAGGSVRIHSSDSQGQMVQVEVADTGIGVEPEVLPKMFDPFEQGERAITNEFSGLGLGLAIGKGVAEAHGGSIKASSPGRGLGTTLTVELPTIVSAPKAAPTYSTGPKDCRVGLKILLVDDHADTLRVMSRLLRKLDHRVTTAESKSAALAAAATNDFDLLISDIGLPDGTGLELMRELLATRPIRGIALTGYGMESDVRQSKDAGFTAHMTKPINFQELVGIIERGDSSELA